MKNSRRRAREFALQALYQWLVNESAAETLLAQLKEQKDFPKADQALAEALLRGAIGNAEALRQLVTPHLDRTMKELSPVEHALLLLSTFELRDHADTRLRAIDCVPFCAVVPPTRAGNTLRFQLRVIK